MNGILGLNVFFRYHEITVIKIIYIITNTSTINCGIFLNFISNDTLTSNNNPVRLTFGKPLHFHQNIYAV